MITIIVINKQMKRKFLKFHSNY